LLILREIIQNMSGIEPTTGLTSDQLEALSGGQTLRQEVCWFVFTSSIESTCNAAVKRLTRERQSC
uniref:IS4 family transposase n=1 Tax=Anisakis simplex TaxID=6269 RepID=A0A0M3JMN3_ANISI